MLHEIQGWPKYKYDDQADAVISYCKPDQPYTMKWVSSGYLKDDKHLRVGLSGATWGATSFTKEQIKQKCLTLGKADTFTGVGYIIGRKDQNKPLTMGTNPKIHPNEEAAKQEALRLARANPGATFYYFKALGSVVTGSTLWHKYV